MSRGSGARVAVALALALVVPGCAALACRPTRIVVVDKEERVRPEPSLSLRTTETGRLEEKPPTLVREYRVQADDGTWYRVSDAQFEAARPGAALEICR